MVPSKNRSAARIILIVLVIVYLISGLSKLIYNSDQVEFFESWGYNSTFMYFIGAMEILGVIGLLIPMTRIYAAVAFAVLMLGAIGTHLINHEYLILLLPLILFILLGALLYWHRQEIQQANLTESEDVEY